MIEVEDIIKLVKSLENSGILLKLEKLKVKKKDFQIFLDH